MGISWGGWEYSGGNGMRVGIDVSWENITHGESAATATIEIYTENQYSYGDDQSLNFGGAIGGSTNFYNGAGGAPVKRATKKYTYHYGNNEYGSSPGKRTFSASLQGAYNGVTPSKSVRVSIPARPIAAPLAPGNVSVSRINNSSQRITWNNKHSAGRPWNLVNVDRDRNDNGNWANVGNAGTNSTGITDGNTEVNRVYQYRARSQNSAGNSSWETTFRIFTEPLIPNNVSRSDGSGSNQVVSWNNRPTYNEYETIIHRGETPAGGSTTWSYLTTVNNGVTSYTDTGADPAVATKYRVRHRTTAGVQPTLYSGWSSQTSETPGITTPPDAPTDLVPDGISVDPTLKQRLRWTFNPSVTGDTQTSFEVQHRRSGAATWNTKVVNSSDAFYDIPANKYIEGQIVEWRVRVKGADPAYSEWAPPVSFQTAIVPIPPDPVKLPVRMDLFTGQLEADTHASEVPDYVRRAQANLFGGGTRAVNSWYGISWSDRFIAISLGRSDRTFRIGYHDIDSPYGWTVTNRKVEVTGGVAMGTLTVSTSDMRIRPGESVTVQNMGTTFNGTWICRSTTSNTVSFELPEGTAAQTQTATSGDVYTTIKGFGSASDLVPSNATINLNVWDALYYELPFGWGSGNVARKNGVVRATSVSLTSNVATVGISNGHWFAVGDRITVENVHPDVDGGATITALTATTITFNRTATNISSTPVTSNSALVRPNGNDTFFGNFKVVGYQADFVVPPNWVLIAIRNNDRNAVEWVTGDEIEPGFDSDSPVFKQAIFSSTQDVNANSGNTPALRVGNINGSHLRMDGNEVQAMDGAQTVGGLVLNAAKGSGGNWGSVNIASDFVVFPNIPQGSFATNAQIVPSNGRIRINTSSRRFKVNEREVELDVKQILRLVPKTFQRNDHRDIKTDEVIGYREDNPWYYGFVAEDAHDLGLKNWVIYEHGGTPEESDGDTISGFAYDQWVVALQAVCREQEARLSALEETVKEQSRQIEALMKKKDE